MVECCVCYEVFSDKDFSLLCYHPLCMDCYDKMKPINTKCPYCRQPIILKRKPIKKLNLRKYDNIRRHLKYKFDLPLSRYNKVLKTKYKLLRIALCQP